MPKVKKIKKRDGTITDFEPQKIQNAILAGLNDVKGEQKTNETRAKKLAQQVAKQAEKEFAEKGVMPTVEDIQDLVEEVLMKNKLTDVAKAYILYRHKHKAIREFKQYLGVRDDLKLSRNAIRVLAKRYLLKNEEGEIIETPSRMFRRVAKAIAKADKAYGKPTKQLEETFYEMMSNLEFLPNSPTLFNAGAELGQLSACFVLPVEDDLEKIMETLKNTAIIHKSGGGTGYSFGRLRPKGDIVRSTQGKASGPISFMKIYDQMTEVVKQGGKRRGANMGILPDSHPDVQEFISTKKQKGALENFNISITTTDKFMEAAEKDKEWKLINPRTRAATQTINAKELFDLAINSAHETADPGMVFIDEVNRKNPTKRLGDIESTNPCGEQPLHPNESCNLGSINLTKFVKNGKPNWKRLKETVHKAVHFLDNVIDINIYPTPEIEEMTKGNRRIGLGIMGFAEMLIMQGIPYNSQKALDFADKLMKFINDEARKASKKLAEERGDFPNYDKSTWKEKKMPARNATVTTIAPTGTISIIADASSGIEPLFAVAYTRNVLEHTKLLEVNKFFEHYAREKGFYSKQLMFKIAKKGSVQGLKEVPKNIQKLFVTALDITPEWHVKMQAAFQKHVENAVSKTINLPEKAKPKDVEKAYKLAHKLKCKGITIYRYGSKKEQVLYIGKEPKELVTVSEEYAGGPLCEECVH